MRTLLTLFAALFITVQAWSQVPVQVELPKTEWKKSEKVHFIVKASPEHLLEIAVFSEEEVVLYQQSRLSAPQERIELDMSKFPPAKYHILILGDDIHLQKEFYLVE
ncbi:MAG TPA: hypothetical protein VIK71_01570 [Flavobacteriales bacterium]